MNSFDVFVIKGFTDTFRGVLIHSLAQTVHYLTTEDKQQRLDFQQAEHPARWYWGLIQVILLNKLDILRVLSALYLKKKFKQKHYTI